MSAAAPTVQDPRPPALDTGVRTGGAVFVASASLVHAGNYLFNLVMGRWLGPERFAELSLIVTLMLLFSVATTTFELVAARFTATTAARGGSVAAVHATLLRWAWLAGGAAAGVLIVGAPVLADLFRSPSAWPYAILGAGVPVYLAQGVHRGVLQGETRFGRLAASFQAEMVVRLAVGIGLVAMGAAVNGAVTAIAASFVATWLVARPRTSPGNARLDAPGHAQLVAFARSSAVLLIGQVLINNSDVLIVKAGFDPATAGRYAAVALVGRAVFFATWSIVMVVFPLAARRSASGTSTAPLLRQTVGLVAGLSAAAVLAAALAPELILNTLFGGAYADVGPLLAPYALASGLFAVANAIVNHDLAVGDRRGSRTTLLAGVSQVGLLALFHGSLMGVIQLQIALMCAYLAVVLIQRRRG